MGIMDNIFSSDEQLQIVKGYMDWRFGMTRDEVINTPYGPFTDVPSTGGLTTDFGYFLEKKTTIAFNFNQGKLNRIQIWVYHGKEKGLAAIAFANVYDYLLNRNKVECNAVDLKECEKPVDLAEIMTKKLSEPREKDEIRKYQFKLCGTKPDDVIVFCSLIDHPVEGYYVFLYFDKKI